MGSGPTTPDATLGPLTLLLLFEVLPEASNLSPLWLQQQFVGWDIFGSVTCRLTPHLCF